MTTKKLVQTISFSLIKQNKKSNPTRLYNTAVIRQRTKLTEGLIYTR